MDNNSGAFDTLDRSDRICLLLIVLKLAQFAQSFQP